MGSKIVTDEMQPKSSYIQELTDVTNHIWSLMTRTL